MLLAIKKIIGEHLLLVLACLCTIAVYFSVLFYGHISWDDPEMVFKNQMVHNFDVKGLFSNQFVGNYIPFTMLLHSLCWFLFENNNGGHHLINIVLHLTNGVLVYHLGRRIFQNPSITNLAMIIFLLHPLQVESVGWISELKNILSTTFFLCSMILYLRLKEKKKKIDYFLCLGLFIGGCLSKPSAVVLPLSLLCLDLILEHKISMRSLIFKIPFFMISVVAGIINIKTQTAAQFINHSHEFPIYQRAAYAGFAILKYLTLFLYPLKLSVIYPYPAANMAVFVTGFLVLLAVAALVIFFIRKKNFVWLSILLFVIVNLLLVLQFLPFGEVLYADRYMYVPIIGLGWITGLFVSRIKISTRTIGIICMLLFSVLTFSRTRSWSSALVLYEDIIKKYPDLYVALNSAGVESMFMNEDAKALDYFNRAVSAAPRNYKSYYNRGLLYLKNGKAPEAIQSFNETLDLYDYGKAYTGRASAYYLQNDIPKAMNDARRALTMDASNSKAHFVLANCYNDLNQLPAAIAEYNKSIQFNNMEPDYYFKRAIVFGKQQKFKECRDDLEVCLHLNAEYYEAYYWRGVAKVNLNQDPCEDLNIAARHNFEPAVIAYNKFCR